MPTRPAIATVMAITFAAQIPSAQATNVGGGIASDAPPPQQPPPPPQQPPPGGYYAPPTQAPPPPPQGYVAPGPATMPYQEGDPVPPGYHIERRRSPLVGAGFQVFGGFYIISVLVGAIGHPHDSNYDWLFLPVAGPFVMSGVANPSDAGKSLLTLDGACQVIGVGLGLLGLALSGDVLVRHVASVTVTPLASQSAKGLQVSGTF